MPGIRIFEVEKLLHTCILEYLDMHCGTLLTCPADQLGHNSIIMESIVTVDYLYGIARLLDSGLVFMLMLIGAPIDASAGNRQLPGARGLCSTTYGPTSNCAADTYVVSDVHLCRTVVGSCRSICSFA